MPLDALPLRLKMEVQEKKIRWKVAQQAEIRWWQGYLKNRPKKVYLAWKENYWLQFLQDCQYLPQKGERVLDAGCGPAGIFMALSEQEVDAFDPLLDQYEQKLEQFSRADYPWVQFKTMALEDFSVEQPYDTVFCLNAINHVSDLDRCFDQLVAATRPGGTLVVSIDAHNYSLFKSIFRLIPGDILHPHQYDLEEYQDMLRQRGLEIQNCKLLKQEFFFNYYVIVAQRK